jgi:hypothetical protein
MDSRPAEPFALRGQHLVDRWKLAGRLNLAALLGSYVAKAPILPRRNQLPSSKSVIRAFMARTEFRLQKNRPSRLAVTIACDTISFNQEVDPVFQFDAGAGEIIFDTYSGRLPFDFMSNRYPHGLFNFVTTSGINATKIRIFGIGNAFQRSQMEEMKVVAIDGMPQHSWKNVIEHQYGKDLVFWLKNP